jgi:hypothetical protein
MLAQDRDYPMGTQFRGFLHYHVHLIGLGQSHKECHFYHRRLNLSASSDLPDGNLRGRDACATTAGARCEYDFVYPTLSVEDYDLAIFAQSYNIHQVMQFPARDLHMVAGDLTRWDMEIIHLRSAILDFRLKPKIEDPKSKMLTIPLSR